MTPEDFFLGVDPLRHPGVSCSDALVLKVNLPDTKLADIDLDVRPTCVRLSAPKYKVKVQLGERVDDQKGARCPPLHGPLRSTRVCADRPVYRSSVHESACTRSVLPLPRNTSGDAKWDGDKSVLTVTLPIIHDWETKLTVSAADELD